MVTGVASGTIVLDTGHEIVEAGGSAVGDVVSSGGVLYDFGTTTGTTVSGGGVQLVFGVASSTVVISGGHDIVETGGVGISTLVRNQGVEYVFGTVSGMNVSGGGFAFIEAGAVASGTVLSNGGMEIVNGGSADAVSFVGGGYLQLDNSVSGGVGIISGFTAATDRLDLRDLAYVSGSMTSSFVEAASNLSGTLTVSNGTSSASIVFAGSHTAANFILSDDLQGGTLIIDPPLSAPINSALVLDSPLDRVITGGAQSIDVLAGTDVSQAFSLLNGDKLDLTSILAGAPIAPDLANIGNFVQVLGIAGNDAGFGAGVQTVLQVNGPIGYALVHLEGSGKLELQDLLSHNSLILPPH
jgi:autotransporter passenger strand-loop-strand repeat protein